MPFPFELSPDELEGQLEELVDAVWGSLQSNFLTLPRGPGFLEYERFAAAYDILLATTKRFEDWQFKTVWAAFERDPVVFIVVRTILGMTPPEWADLTSQAGIMLVTQGQARTLDRRVREPNKPLSGQNMAIARAMFESAIQILTQSTLGTSKDEIHRLDKIDTKDGLNSLKYVASSPGVPYPMLLYERFLGRPFASHRDAVSDIIGDVMENAIEEVLVAAGITPRKTKRAERVPGFEQAPDFIIPDELRPRVVIEAKITADDGTARDKVTRILHLRELSDQRRTEGRSPFQVVACIDGRGFGIRREDMRKLILATEGKVFTLATLDRLVDCTNLVQFRTKP